MISPSNTDACLTRPCRGMRPGELADRYPAGSRNYVRIAAADHLQAAAQVELAKQLGARRLFIAWDADDDWAAGFAEDMRAAARRRGLDVVGTGTWRPGARGFESLARTAATTRPHAVLLSGAAPPFVGALIRDLRSRLRPEVTLVANDGFAGFDELIGAAGRAAQGMYVGSYGVPDASCLGAGGNSSQIRCRRRLTRARRLGGLRRPGGRDPARCDRPLGRHPPVRQCGAPAGGALRTAFSGTSGSTRTAISSRPITYFRVVGDGAVVDRVVMVRAAPLGE